MQKGMLRLKTQKNHHELNSINSHLTNDSEKIVFNSTGSKEHDQARREQVDVLISSQNFRRSEKTHEILLKKYDQVKSRRLKE